MYVTSSTNTLLQHAVCASTQDLNISQLRVSVHYASYWRLIDTARLGDCDAKYITPNMCISVAIWDVHALKLLCFSNVIIFGPFPDYILNIIDIEFLLL